MQLPKQKLPAGLTLVFALAFFFMPLATQAAAAATSSGLLPACAATGACRFCDIVNVFITLGKGLIAASGGLALLMIVWAGISMATSGGNPEKITAAKKNIGGAILGLGAVLAAFQFVSILIAFVALPSSSETFQQSQTPDASTQNNASLSRFLGIPWWQICSEQDLRLAGPKNEKISEYKGTAICRYWGDNTPCSPVDANGQAAKRCCRGLCADGACTAVVVPEEIQPTAIRIKPPAPAVTANLQELCPALTDTQDETQVRACLNDTSKHRKVLINRTVACPLGVRYQDSARACTTVAGLSSDTIYRIIMASEAYSQVSNENLMITGGTELGHKSHGPPYVFDLAGFTYDKFLNNQTIKDLGFGRSTNFGEGCTCETAGGAAVPGSDICDGSNTNHLHCELPH